MDFYRLCSNQCLLCACMTFISASSITAAPLKSSAAQPTNSVPGEGPSANHGYALLFDLMGDEKNVSKLLIIKRERLELKDVVKAISRTAGDARKQLEKFGKAEPALNLKDKGLPGAEIAARESISKAKAKELLTDKGKDFELKLLLSQNEALTYGEHLALTIAQKETHPQRLKFLQNLTRDLGQLREQVVGILSAHYGWAPDAK